MYKLSELITRGRGAREIKLGRIRLSGMEASVKWENRGSLKEVTTVSGLGKVLGFSQVERGPERRQI